MATPTVILPTLASLEPIAGAGLAVTLAYLALDRFRYRNAVESCAKEYHKKYENDSELGKLKDLDVLNELRWLHRSDGNDFKPVGFHGTLYSAVFRKHLDVFIISALAVLAGFTLICGVALQIGTWSWLGWAGQSWAIQLFFYVCAAAIALPSISVLGGRSCKNWGVKRAQHCDGQVAKYQQAGAKRASAPDTEAARTSRIVEELRRQREESARRRT